MIRHAHAKFSPLNFINKKNERETRQTEHPLYDDYVNDSVKGDFQKTLLLFHIGRKLRGI